MTQSWNAAYRALTPYQMCINNAVRFIALGRPDNWKENGEDKLPLTMFDFATALAACFCKIPEDVMNNLLRTSALFHEKNK
jgi:hypothetical protein